MTKYILGKKVGKVISININPVLAFEAAPQASLEAYYTVLNKVNQINFQILNKIDARIRPV